MVMVLLLGLMPTTSFASVGTGWNDDCRGNTTYTNTGTVLYGKHNWVKQFEDPGNTCTSPGVAGYRCSYCGANATRDTAAPGHQWGSWTTLQTATCVSTGSRVRVCTKCGERDIQSTSKTDHSYGAWVILKEATCQSAGSQQRTCNVCGHVEVKTIAKTKDHNYGAWKVVREATCQQKGLRTRTCKTCGHKQEQSTKKTAHQYGDWVVTVETTDHSAGERTHSCIWCGKTEKESFDPEGTLRRGDKGDEVKEMQHLLADQGLMKDSAAKGTFNAATEKAVAKFQKDRGLKSDGVAWPQTRALLAHHWSDWEIVVPTTPFSAGLRVRTCSDCGKKQEEEFDPEGTLRRNDSGEAVRDLQIAMKALGIFKYNTTGTFGKNTENSVKKFQKSKGLKSDGVAWPGVIDMILGKDPNLPKPEKEPKLPEPKLPEPEEPEENPEGKVLPAFLDEINFTISFVDLKAQKAKLGERVYITVRLTNTYKSKIRFDSVGCSDGYPEDLIAGGNFKGELEPGESTEYMYAAMVTEEALAQGYVVRTMTAKATDPDTNQYLQKEEKAHVGLLKEGPYILLIAEDVSASELKAGETADVRYWCFNAGDCDLTNIQFDLMDEDYLEPSLDSIQDLPAMMPDIWFSGSEFEFVYHVEATSDDVTKGHVWRAATVTANDVETGDITGAVGFFLMGIAEEPLIEPVKPDFGKPLDPQITMTIGNVTPTLPALGNEASFIVRVVNTGAMDVQVCDWAYDTEDTIELNEWMSDPLEPGINYLFKYRTKVTMDDLIMKQIIRDFELGVVDPETERTAYAKVTAEIDFLKAEVPPAVSPVLEDYVAVHKTFVNPPVKGFFEKDDTIIYELTVENTSETEIAKNIALDDDRIGFHTTVAVLEPHDQLTFHVTYTVTQIDAMMPYILNTASATWKDGEGNSHTSISNTVMVQTGVNVDEVMSLSLVKKVDDSPENYLFYVQGEQIDFIITATNTGNVTIGYAEITDLLEKENLGKIGDVIDLGPGESIDFKFSYKVTGKDVEATQIVNTATAVCMASGFLPLTVVSNEVTCPTGVFPEELIEGLNLIKGETSTPKNGKFYVEGETIHYAITLINYYRQTMGSLPLIVYGGTIYDLLEPAPGAIATVVDLKPGEFITVPYSYKVTAFDVGKGQVVNMATFEGDTSKDERITVVSNEVVSPTGAYTGKPKGNDICVRTLLEHSSSSEHATLDYCEEHAKVAERVEALVSRATTEAELLAAWQTAIDIWNEALNLEYQDRLAHAGKTLAEAIQSEWVQFHLQATNCRNAMIRKAGGENSEIAKLIAEMLMNHCADLCGESSLTAAQRKDSVLDAKKTMNLGFAPAQCMEQTRAIEGGLDISTILCETHQKTEKIVDTMLEGLSAADKEALAMVWQRAEDLWTVELDRKANERFSTAGDGGQLYILERVTFGDWLVARKAMLDAEYPDAPEIVQELIVRAVRERVMALCAQD